MQRCQGPGHGSIHCMALIWWQARQGIVCQHMALQAATASSAPAGCQQMSLITPGKMTRPAPVRPRVPRVP